MPRPIPHHRHDYLHTCEITTRWMDNDAYGHVNNVVFYSWFDTVVNEWSIARGLLDVGHSPIIGLVVESGCHYFEPLAYPGKITAALRVAHVGNSSVRYEIGIFGEGRDGAAAQGHFVHVYVDRETRRPKPLPETWRAALATITTRES
ncbi:MAG: acyl-CoA thioesterase [Verrucomicrobiaceae bacterium]|nr:acyl-CoA thioesterase [Verrucomicrobiaceae bacterium]